MKKTSRELSAFGRGSGKPAVGFTLTEMVVVMGIILLLAITAVPVFRVMTGGRSTEAARNQISSMVSRARTESLGLEEPRGILFYRDLETRRVGMVLVKSAQLGNTTPPFDLDLVPDRDPVLLPDGVGIQFIDDAPGAAAEADKYIGFNQRMNRAADGITKTVVPYGGVILFDRSGKLSSDTYSFRLKYPPPGGGPGASTPSEMGRFLYNVTAANPLAGGLPDVLVPTIPPSSKLGFVLFDAEEFNNNFGEGLGTNITADDDTQNNSDVDWTGENREETWLNENAVPILINRYNGTLVKGE